MTLALTSSTLTNWASRRSKLHKELILLTVPLVTIKSRRSNRSSKIFIRHWQLPKLTEACRKILPQRFSSSVNWRTQRTARRKERRRRRKFLVLSTRTHSLTKKNSTLPMMVQAIFTFPNTIYSVMKTLAMKLQLQLHNSPLLSRTSLLPEHSRTESLGSSSETSCLWTLVKCHWTPTWTWEEVQRRALQHAQPRH